MPEYTLILKVPSAGNKQMSYSVLLTGTDVDHPDDFFHRKTPRGNENRLRLLQAIKQAFMREVSNEQLNWIIKKWEYGIKYGKGRETTLEISLSAETIFNDSSVSEIPNYSYNQNLVDNLQSTAKPLTTYRDSHISSSDALKDAPKPKVKTPIYNNQDRVDEQSVNKTKIQEPVENNSVIAEIWTDDNKADF